MIENVKSTRRMRAWLRWKRRLQSSESLIPFVSLSEKNLEERLKILKSKSVMMIDDDDDDDDDST